MGITVHASRSIQSTESLLEENESLKKCLSRKSIQVDPEAALAIMKENERLKERHQFLQSQMTSANLKEKKRGEK